MGSFGLFEAKVDFFLVVGLDLSHFELGFLTLFLLKLVWVRFAGAKFGLDFKAELEWL
jgi:hypothetical protein